MIFKQKSLAQGLLPALRAAAISGLLGLSEHTWLASCLATFGVWELVINDTGRL